MVQQEQDTIAAIAKPPGVGAIGIVRVSGPRARAIAHAITGVLPPPKQATHRVFRAADGSPLDKGLVLYWLVNNLLSIGQQWMITRKIAASGG